MRLLSVLPLLITVMGLEQSLFAQSKPNLTVYSARKDHLIAPLFDAYEKKTGVKIQYVTDKAPALLERVKAEGKRTNADILMTVDAGNLWAAAEAGVLQPLNSESLKKAVPEAYRDPNMRWVGLSLRARTLAYDTRKIKPSDLKSYEDLADPKWKGKLCLRTSKKVYNQSLVAMLMAELGAKETEKVVQGWVDNLAAKVFPNDTAALEAVAAGQCAVAIVNTYYYGRLKDKNEKLPVALYFPKEKAGGTHVNVSGAGILKHAKNADAAEKLLEWLVTADAQKMFAEVNHEYPVVEKVAVSPSVKSWGAISPMTTNLSIAGEKQAEAIKLMDRVGYR